jgi:hypothetical protein
MAMGTRPQREKQQNLWIATNDVVETPANAFCDRLNQMSTTSTPRWSGLCRKFYEKSATAG